MNQIIIIIGLILLNGIFSMSEIAILSARRTKLEKDSEKGNKGAQTVIKLASDPDIFLSTIQIGITLIGILTGMFSGDALANDFGHILTKIGVSASIAPQIAQITILIIVTYLTLVLGELVPKRIGIAAADRIARIMARPVYWLSVITKPAVWLLAKSTSLLVAISGIKKEENKVTEEEIKSMIQEGIEGGEVQKVEQDIMERVLLMGDMKVRAIMTHRSDITWIDVNASATDVEYLIHRNLHDYYPVADKSLDKIIGFVSLKNIIKTISNDDFSIPNITQPATAFHEEMSLYNGLELLKEEGHIGCALVYDEFGNCQGIITLRDILEGLIGIINSEHNEPQIIARKDGGWLIDGQCTFYDFIVYFELEDDSSDTDYNTVSGLILSHLDAMPQSGTIVTWRNFKLEVVDMDGARIDKVLVTKTQ